MDVSKARIPYLATADHFQKWGHVSKRPSVPKRESNRTNRDGAIQDCIVVVLIGEGSCTEYYSR